jgi:hypothetical protein
LKTHHLHIAKIGRHEIIRCVAISGQAICPKSSTLLSNQFTDETEQSLI